MNKIQFLDVVDVEPVTSSNSGLIIGVVAVVVVIAVIVIIGVVRKNKNKNVLG